MGEGNPRPQNRYWLDTEEMARLFTSFDDIEGIVTELENPTPGSPASKLSQGGRGSILAGLRNVLCEFFDSIRTNDAPLYRHFANEVVQPGDIVISLNYDVSLDRELRRAGKWQISDGYGFDFGMTALPRSTVKLLKLHGSTDDGGGQVDGLAPRQTVILGHRRMVPQKKSASPGGDRTLGTRFVDGGIGRCGI